MAYSFPPAREGLGSWEDTLLEVAGVTKSYGAMRALDAVSFRVGAGEIVSLLGPNGAGKTTLASIISGLLPPDAGTVTIDGHDLQRDGRAARGRLGVAAQDIALVRMRSVRQNLRFFGALAGVRGRELDRRIDGLIDDFGLDRIIDKKVLLLSGGEQRRAHVAAALVGRAQVLVLDEPTAAADLESQTTILRRIARERDEGRTVLYTTHAMDEVTELGARVVIIDRGRVVVDGTVAELVAEHARGAVEVRFAADVGRPPAIPGATVDGSIVRVATDEPAKVIADVLRAIPGADVLSIDVIRPGLAAAFLSLTGRQFEIEARVPEDGAA